MNGTPSVWRRVRHLEARRPPGGWTGPLPIVCPQDWPAAEHAAWAIARAAGDEAAMDALIKRHTGVHLRPLRAGIRCVVDHRPPPGEEQAWAG